MRFGMLVAATVPLLALGTLEISRASRRIRPAHEENIRKLIENDGVLRSQTFALPDSRTGNTKGEPIALASARLTPPRFVEVPKEDYDDFKRSIQALTKLMKPESVETLKRLTTSIASEKTRDSASQRYAIAPDKLTTLVESAVSAHRPDAYTPSTVASNNSWVQQFSQVPAATSFQPLPPTVENQQSGPPPGWPAPVAPYISSPMYLRSMPLSQAQDASFRQLAPPGYEAFPNFQYVPQASNSDPLIEFTNPLQLAEFA